MAHRGPGASSIWRRTAQSSRGSCRSWQWRIYGVLAAFVTQHASEIGIRLALSAQTADVMHLVLRRGMGLALVGVLLGLMTAWVMTRLMKTLLFGVGVADPMTFTVIALMRYALRSPPAGSRPAARHASIRWSRFATIDVDRHQSLGSER